MINVLLVFIGGGSGAALRYLASLGTAAALRPYTHNDEGMPHADAAIGLLPLATLAVNIVGCLLIGLLIPVLAGKDDQLRLVLVVGVLGGFTTFSAFGYETVTLHHNGHTAIAAGYVLASVVLGVAAVLIGMAVTGQLASEPAP